MSNYQYAREAAGKALGYAAAAASADGAEIAALRGIGYAILALAEAVHQLVPVPVEHVGPRGRSQVIATDGGTVTGVKQSIG